MQVDRSSDPYYNIAKPVSALYCCVHTDTTALVATCGKSSIIYLHIHEKRETFSNYDAISVILTQIRVFCP